MGNWNVISITFAVLFVIAFGFNGGVTGSRPTLFPDKEQIIIQEGDELRISCVGRGEIQFSREDVTAWIDRSPYTVTRDDYSDAYVFSLPNATRTDTGWYACAENGVEIENTERTIEHPTEDISWIYVYVNSSEPFAIMEAFYDIISAQVGGNAVIPCRPTSPGLDVLLRTEDGSPALEQLPYDPRIGFIVGEIRKTQSGENFECYIRESENDDQMPRYALHVSDLEVLEKVVILQENLDHIVWGQNLTLKCEVTLSEGERFTLLWETPSSVPADRFVIESTKLINRTGTKHTWRTSLTISGVVAEDAGNYTCTADNLFAKRTAWQEIQVYAPNAAPDPVGEAVPELVCKKNNGTSDKLTADEHFYLSIAKDVQNFNLSTRLRIKKAVLDTVTTIIEHEKPNCN